jgi:hypothetical protein
MILRLQGVPGNGSDPHHSAGKYARHPAFLVAYRVE